MSMTACCLAGIKLIIIGETLKINTAYVEGSYPDVGPVLRNYPLMVTGREGKSIGGAGALRFSE